MNSSLISADATTHLKILVLAMLAGIIVMWIGINARGAATADRSEDRRIGRSISKPDVPRVGPPRTGSVLVV